MKNENMHTSAWGNGGSGKYTLDCFPLDNLKKEKKKLLASI
jgi:hypothetical protein